MVIENGGNAVLLDVNTDAGKNAGSELGKNALFVQTDFKSLILEK